MTRTLGQAVLATASLVALSAVVACGGGGGGGGSQAGPPGATVQSHALFTITVPSGSSTSSRQRGPAYVSPNTQSVSIALSGGATTTANLTPSSPNCTPATATAPLTCTVSLNAPAGNDTFTLTMFSGLNATGSALSTATVSAQISATQTTTVPVTLGGVIASIAVSVTNGNNLVPGGFATTLPVVVTAKDASGAAIVGPGNYSNPITLTNADTSGVTTLSTTTVTSPSTTVTLAYAPTDANSGVLAIGGLPVGATTIGASATGVAASAVSPGTFQYIADRFFGYGHTRTLTGTGTAILTTYDGAGVPSPNPSTWVYTITDALTVHGVTFDGMPASSSNHAITYAQTSPVTAAAPETEAKVQIRTATSDTTGAILYRAAETDTDVNSFPTTSPMTGYLQGTTAVTWTYTPATWEEDVLPHVSGSTWTNTNVPFTQAYTNSEIATFQLFADGSTGFDETYPLVFTQTQTASGAATIVNDYGPYGVTTSISLPVAATPPGSGDVIPVAEATTSPAPGPTATYFPVDWYPGGGAPVTPAYTYLYSEVNVPIPGACNVPATVATQSYAVVQEFSQLDIASFRNRQQIYTDYFVPNGIGFVCETYLETTTNYRYTTGIMSAQKVVTYVYGVTSDGALGIRRSH